MTHPSSTPFLAHLRLAELARADGQRVFLREALSDGGDLDYATLLDNAARLASVLRSMGLQREDRVFAQLGNRWETLGAFFAVSMLGAVLVPIAPNAAPDDVAFAVEQTQPLLGLVLGGRPDCVHLVQELGLPNTSLLAVGGEADCDLPSFTEVVAAAAPLTEPVPGRPTDVLAVMYKSGTSGWPNGVMFTQANLRYAGMTYAALTRMQSEDRLLVSLPLSHVTGLGNMVEAALWSGASLGLCNDLGQWAATAARQQSTLANLSSVDVAALVAGESPSVIPQHLRLVVYGPAVPHHTRTAFEQRFRTELRVGYGMTEAVAPIALVAPTVSVEDNCVGEVHTPQALQVVDEHGTPVPFGEPGELIVNGVPGLTLAAGYYGRPELSEEVFSSGALHTGDRVVLHQDGRLQFVARYTETLKIGVATISTVEIERVLKEHVGIADAAVIGVSGSDGLESLTAFVVMSDYHPDLDVEELSAWLATRVGPERLPDRYHQVDSLPYSQLGKVLKSHLARLL